MSCFDWLICGFVHIPYESYYISGIKYNAQKEEKAEQEKKKRQLEAIELARKLEEEKKKAGKAMCSTVNSLMDTSIQWTPLLEDNFSHPHFSYHSND